MGASAAQQPAGVPVVQVGVKLSPEMAPLYKAATLQYRKLKTLLTRLEKLSQTILRQQAKLTQSHRD